MQSDAFPKRAAQYVRMSTERQDSSVLQQKAAIAAYANSRGYDVVRTYADEGVSGLLIDQRSGLKAMLADVLNGNAGFEVILVYDVSRWGRFQNPDQAALLYGSVLTCCSIRENIRPSSAQRLEPKGFPTEPLA